MFIDKNSLRINGVNMGEYLTSVEYGYNKLWADDTGRNLAGEQSGTLLGIFPKLVLHFRKLNKDELQTIVPILDSASQQVTYYDLNKKANTTITTYTGDYTITSDGIGKTNAFSISFIATKKRS